MPSTFLIALGRAIGLLEGRNGGAVVQMVMLQAKPLLWDIDHVSMTVSMATTVAAGLCERRGEEKERGSSREQ